MWLIDHLLWPSLFRSQKMFFWKSLCVVVKLSQRRLGRLSFVWNMWPIEVTFTYLTDLTRLSETRRDETRLRSEKNLSMTNDSSPVRLIRPTEMTFICFSVERPNWRVVFKRDETESKARWKNFRWQITVLLCDWYGRWNRHSLLLERLEWRIVLNRDETGLKLGERIFRW